MSTSSSQRWAHTCEGLVSILSLSEFIYESVLLCLEDTVSLKSSITSNLYVSSSTLIPESYGKESDNNTL